MKAIIQCYTPEECERIANGEQTVKVCKTAPKDTPFKVYIYQTKESKRRFLDHRFNSFFAGTSHYKDMGKVIGEFICDRADKFSCKCIPRQGISLGYERFTKDGVYLLNNNDTDCVVFERQDRYLDTMLKNADLAAMCLTPQELFDYAGGFSKPLYGLHKSELKIYEEPKELSEFRKPCHFTCMENSKKKGDCGTCGELQPVTHPPQSWCYVEEN